MNTIHKLLSYCLQSILTGYLKANSNGFFTSTKLDLKLQTSFHCFRKQWIRAPGSLLNDPMSTGPVFKSVSISISIHVRTRKEQWAPPVIHYLIQFHSTSNEI